MPAPVIVAHDDKATRELAVAALIAAGLTAVGFHDLMAALNAVEDDSRVRVLVARIDFGVGKPQSSSMALGLMAIAHVLLLSPAGRG